MDLSKYLRPTFFIESEDPIIKKKAIALTHDKKEISEKAKALFYFVRDEIRYNAHLLKLKVQNNKATEVLKKKEGYI